MEVRADESRRREYRERVIPLLQTESVYIIRTCSTQADFAWMGPFDRATTDRIMSSDSGIRTVDCFLMGALPHELDSSQPCVACSAKWEHDHFDGSTTMIHESGCFVELVRSTLYALECLADGEMPHPSGYWMS